MMIDDGKNGIAERQICTVRAPSMLPKDLHCEGTIDAA
jgi:hypothetical protein